MGLIINPRQIIKDGITSLRDVWSSSKVSSELGGKQATLVSGVNIKTVNTHSLLGSGDIHISGGGDIPKINMTATTATLDPNKFYVWGEVASLDISLAAETAGIQNVYKFQFESGNVATTLTLPNDIEWSGGIVPDIRAKHKYIITILSNIAKMDYSVSTLGSNQYIPDGLIFQIDGIDKGPNAGSWTDIIGGRVYNVANGTPQFYDNNVTFNTNNCYFECTDNPIQTSSLEYCTLEICCDSNYCMPMLCFGNQTAGAMFLTVDGVGYNYVMSYQPNLSFPGSFTSRTVGTFQCDRSRILVNGNAQTTGSAGVGLTGNVIGCWRVQSAANYLKVYCIRIYNRVLADFELEHNREVDALRFNLI